METAQRSARPQLDEDMDKSAFTVPLLKDKISARVEGETKKKLHVIVEIWKVQTRVDVENRCKLEKRTASETKEVVEAAVDQVDLTYVIDKLLKSASDFELKQWGGYPDTPEKLAEALKKAAQK